MKWSNLTCVLFLIASILAVTTASNAQIVTVTDNTCTAATQCDDQSGHGCNSTTFTVPSNGTYQVTASIDGCSGGSTACASCLSEAYVYKQSDPTHVLLCVHNDCGGSCASQSGFVSLSAGITYILYSCKIDCSGDDCSNCSTSCVARATVGLFP